MNDIEILHNGVYSYQVGFWALLLLPPGVAALNVRATPNGAIVGQLRGAVEVIVLPNVTPIAVASYWWAFVYVLGNWNWLALLPGLSIVASSTVFDEQSNDVRLPVALQWQGRLTFAAGLVPRAA